MLHEGQWYRWFGEGVCLVERIGGSQATVKVFWDEEVSRDFDTASGKHVSFSTRKTKRLGICLSASLEPATPEEVARYTGRRPQK